MKITTIALIFLLINSTAVIAKDTKQKRFDQNKQNIITNLDNRIKIFQDFKLCVSSSKSRTDIKACRVTFKTSSKALATQNKAKREAIKAERAKRKANIKGHRP